MTAWSFRHDEFFFLFLEINFLAAGTSKAVQLDRTATVFSLQAGCLDRFLVLCLLYLKIAPDEKPDQATVTPQLIQAQVPLTALRAQIEASFFF